MFNIFPKSFLCRMSCRNLLHSFKKHNGNIFKRRFCEKNNNKDDIENNDNIEQIREKLIRMSLLNVEKYGFSENAIKLAANELGYSNSLSGILENGEMDLVFYNIDNWNKKLKIDLEEIKKDSTLSIDEKYKKALKLRLSYEIPLIHIWPQAMRLGMSPQYIKNTLFKLLQSVEEICSMEDGQNLSQLEHNNSNNSLIKRYLILKIFLLTEIRMITDRSYNFKSTWEWLEFLYDVNFSFYSSFSKFLVNNKAALSMLRYSLLALAPYDFSKVDEILQKQNEDFLAGQKNDNPKSSLSDNIKL
jgi:rpsU-divergently transcribed protein